MYKNIMLKISGESLAGDNEQGFDFDILNDLSQNIKTLASKNMLVGEALNLMNNKKITSLFVCENKKPVGIIHIHDLLRLTS